MLVVRRDAYIRTILYDITTPGSQTSFSRQDCIDHCTCPYQHEIKLVNPLSIPEQDVSIDVLC